ncbi:MAG: DUF1566 domain-containing protein [Myxococcaceae bacterium]
MSNESYTGLEQRQLTSAGLNALLAYMAPQIKKLPGYTGLFVANCSIFINTQVDEVNCEIVPVASVALQTGYRIAPGPRLPPQYGSQITRSSILLVSMFADWTRRKTEFSEQYELVLYDRVWTCSKTVTVSSSVSNRDTLSNTMSAFLSESKSKTWSKSFSRTMALVPMLTTLIATTLVPSTAVPTTAIPTTMLPSTSIPTTLIPTTAIPSTQIPTTLVPTTAIPTTLVPSTSVPTTAGPSSAPLTYTCTGGTTTPPTNGLLAAWNASSGVYGDATNQTNRYNISNWTALDTLTGIIWEQNVSSSPMNFTQAQSYCAGRNTGGLSGWRVPNIVELGTLVDYTNSTPPHLNGAAFTGATAVDGWSSSPEIGNGGGNSWYVRFSSLYVYSTYQTNSTPNQVRCMRSCYQIPPTSRYTNASGEVTDLVTGLIWQQRAPTTANWTNANAISYCSSLSLNGRTWRLPRIRELATIVDYNASYASLMMNRTVFPGEPANWFWSSTPVAGFPSSA